MRERNQQKVKRKRAFIRMSILLVPLVVLLYLSQTVFAQNTYVISDGGKILVHTSSATDPALVLTEAGLALGADDTYTALTENGISEITVQRAHTVTVNNCGDTFQVTATGETVGELLHRLSIDLQGEVTVSAPLEMDVYDGLTVTVCRTLRQAQTYTVSIPCETVYCYDSSVPQGVEEVINPGQAGQLLCTADVIYVDGEETGRTVIEERVIAQPVNRLVAIGTKPEEPPSTDPMDGIVIDDGYIYLPDGQVLSYTGTMQVIATAYSHLDQGCDTITATGTTVHHGTVAVDPRLIPLGTRMFIITNDGAYVYGISTAEDTGSSIKEYRVDLYFPTKALCFQFGVRGATVYFLT